MWQLILKNVISSWLLQLQNAVSNVLNESRDDG